MDADPLGTTAERYERFAAAEATGVSESYARWARQVAADPDLLSSLVGLPEASRQPNLVFAAARALGARPGDPGSLEETVSRRWDGLVAMVTSRTTQTNEVGRCATLLPVLATLPQPLALLEVGAAAGLCLHPDRYSYLYEHRDGRTHRCDPTTGRSRVQLECLVDGDPPLPSEPVEVSWRAGIDLNPLDPGDQEQSRWLEALVWPEQDARRERLRRGLALAAADPAPIVRGDLNDLLPAVAGQAPRDATLVVFHSAVLAYVDDASQRRRFVDIVRSLPGHWVSNEGRRVLDIPLPPGTAPATADTLFTVALDGEAKAVAQGHGRSMTWLDR